MAGRTLDIDDLITKDALACRIADQWMTWDNLRANRIAEWKEIRNYVYATDMDAIVEKTLPWKNRTHIPKICQIRDNLYANYMASMFPKRKWLIWEGATKADQDKADAIQQYMNWVVNQTWFKDEVGKLVLDYIDYGMPIATVEWVDETIEREDKTQVGYVGPKIRRINPLDMVMNPLAPSFQQAPKIIRSIVTLGELKDILESQSTTEEEIETARATFNYVKDLRGRAHAYGGDITHKDDFFRMDGFDSLRAYLCSDYVEILTFYGTIYDYNNDELLKNFVISVIDRHKLVYKKPNESLFGTAPFFSSTWRQRQDNLWGMGPLDNLLGMQYRIDQVENQKADIMDLTTVPPLKLKGYVEDFTWGPMEKIIVGDDGDVEVLAPQLNTVQLDIAIQQYEERMEMMAGSPREAMGFRTPGEKTAFEVQRLENAASRIFQNKIQQFEEQVTEKCLNAMLELARRKMEKTVVRFFDDEFKIAVFKELTAADITGSGRIRPVAARHFAEKAEFIQNITQFYSSGLGADPEVRMHLSSVKLADMANSVLDLEDYEIFNPYIRLSEQAEMQKLASVHQDEAMANMMTPANMDETSIDPSALEVQ